MIFFELKVICVLLYVTFIFNIVYWDFFILFYVGGLCLVFDVIDFFINNMIFLIFRFKII